MHQLQNNMLLLTLAFVAYEFEEALCFHPVRFYFINERKTWHVAKTYCNQQYDGLATIASSEDSNRLGESTGGGWIGLADLPSDWRGTMSIAPNSWRWSATGLFNKDGYQNWASNMPNHDQAVEHCVYMRNGLWDDGNCESLLAFVCFTGPVGPGSKHYTFVSTSMTWSQAQAHCRLNYTDLAMVLDEAENSAVASVIPSATQLVWIGMYRVPWRWIGGGAFSFTNWASGEPDNMNGVQQCVKMDANRIWRDQKCGNEYPFYCHQFVNTKASRIKLKLQSETDLSVAAVYNQIVQQLTTKLELMGITDVRLIWKTSARKI